MSGLYIYSSNRLEVLAHELARVLERPLSSAFIPETIVVQSKGMERWLTLKLAGHLGVMANCRFPFPGAFLQQLFTAVLGQGEDQGFLKEHMAFSLMGLLSDIGAKKDFASIAQYLQDDPTGLKRYALARNLADSFDQYLVFRGRMVLAWEKGRAWYLDDTDAGALELWQAMLWRTLNTPAKPHRASLSAALLAVLAGAAPPGLPERVCIFGISYLPPVFIEIFEALARHTDVHLFLMNPCAEYWAYIQSMRSQERVAARAAADAIEDLHLEEGNALLAGLGSQGKYFIDRVLSADDIQTMDDYRAPESATMLACVQNDILTLAEPEARRQASSEDTSIQVHSCHSPMREVEVLHDHLLDLFQNRSGLKPEDILVMAPAVEVYAPYIEAVFGYAGDERLRIPFSIADRPAARQPAIETLLALLQAADGRMGADAVTSLLEIPAVHSRFGIPDDSLPLVRDWIVRTRIRWGYDGPSRAELGLPPEQANTWRAGLDRMLLGFSMPQGAEVQPWHDILPYTAVEGESALLLGRVCEFIECLHGFIQSCAAHKSPADWSTLLGKALDDFCDPDLSQGRQELRLALDRLTAAPFHGPLGLAVVKAWLTDHFRYPSEHGFLSGGITCCSLLPMRSIPFKVICLLGLDNDTFPRRQTRKGFDIMTVKPERGDRSRRDDDRYLFLEALVSARETLYLSYVGQDQQDNSTRPPSVLVSELLDYLEKTFTPPDAAGGQEETKNKHMSAFITRVHRLHGFSAEYFSDHGALFSYSHAQARTATALDGGAGEVRRFITGPIEQGLEEWRVLDIDTLIRFFQHPVRFFLEQRLGVRLPRSEEELENRETFGLTSLARYGAAEQILKARLNGMDPLPILAAEGVLPHGQAGLAAYARLDHAMHGLVERVRCFAPATAFQRYGVDIACGGYHITGSLEASPAGALLYRPGKIRDKDLVGMWIRHVLLNVSHPVVSCALGCDFDGPGAEIKTVRFKPVDAVPILSALLDLFTQGLKTPLAFYPVSSHAFAQGEAEGKDGLKQARSAWVGSDQHEGERADPVYHFHPGLIDPFPGDFAAVSRVFFAPLLEAKEDGA